MLEMIYITEIWKEIDGYEGYYEVSNLGNVRSMDRSIIDVKGRQYFYCGHIMTLSENDDGYYTVKLSKDGTTKRVNVHTLVAKHFVPGYFDGAEVDHIDADRKNNIFSNLRWVTHTDNIKHSIELGNHISLTDRSGTNNPNYGNKTLHMKYSEDRDLAKKKQGRIGKNNGKAKAIRITLTDGTEISFSYIGECANYLISNNLVPSNKYKSICTMIGYSAKRMKTYYGIQMEQI